MPHLTIQRIIQTLVDWPKRADDWRTEAPIDTFTIAALGTSVDHGVSYFNEQFRLLGSTLDLQADSLQPSYVRAIVFAQIESPGMEW